MNNDFIGIDVSGEDVLAAKLKGLPEAAQDEVTDAVSKHLLDNILRIYPPKNYVTRKAAYGQSFQTDRQRKWFFASLADGSLHVPYNRTQNLGKSWRQVGQGRSSFLANEMPGAKFVIGDGTQSRHEKMVGWLTVSQTLQRHSKSIMDKANEAIKKAIKKVGL